ncbi:patatin-like phospholipase family protein [Nocardia asteroides]
MGDRDIEDAARSAEPKSSLMEEPDAIREGVEAPNGEPTVRLLAGAAGRSLALMAGMVSGAVDALTAKRVEISKRIGERESRPMQPIVLGVSGGAIAAAAASLRMSREQMRQVAVDYPEGAVIGKRNYCAMLTRRTLYPDARVRELAHAIVGDRTFADFALDTKQAGRQPAGVESSLIVAVYSGVHGTLFLPRDLPELGLTDMAVANALVAATRIPGAFPAAADLGHLFDGGTHHRVPHEVFGSHPSLILDLYGPRPYYSRGGMILPLVDSSLPMIPRRPRPFHDERLCARTIFAGLPYGSAFKASAQPPGELFDRGYEVAADWIAARSDEQLFAAVDPHVLGRRELAWR